MDSSVQSVAGEVINEIAPGGTGCCSSGVTDSDRIVDVNGELNQAETPGAQLGLWIVRNLSKQ